jgi:uncharacterized protein (TIGR00730 family)
VNGQDGWAGLSVCVFCASASKLPEVHHKAARRLGELIAERGHRLVYGGGSVGLMGEVARAVKDRGGRIFGAIPRTLVERELAFGPADELVVTETLRERKAEMDARADAFVALPGGFGTLEELVEVVTLRLLTLHERPIVLVNVEGYYNPLRALVREMVEQGFAPGGEGDLFEVAGSPEEALDLVESSLGHVARSSPVETLVEGWTEPPGEDLRPGR